MATVDNNKPFTDFYDNCKQIVEDDYSGSNTLSLNATTDIYMWDVENPDRFPCIKIIPGEGGDVESIGLPTLVRFRPSALIEYHDWEIRATEGYKQVSEMLYNLISLFLKNDSSSRPGTVNGWGMDARITNITPVRYASGQRYVWMAGLRLTALSGKYDIS
jgi:hypothetical protein